MLFTFKSASIGNLIMHEKSGKEILALLGKNPEDQRGIITVDQLPSAILTLQAAVSADKAMMHQTTTQTNELEPSDNQTVSLSQRAVPFIEMLECALEDKEPVVWGV